MKNKMRLVTIGMLLLILIGFAPKGNGQTVRQVLSKNIEYEVKINNFIMINALGLEESNHSWFRNNIEASARGAFLELLFKNAREGKLQLFDMNDKPADIRRLNELLFASADTLRMTRAYPPYQEYDTTISKSIPSEEITALRFREEWTYDPSTLAIKKKVLAYAPVWTPITFDKDQKEVYGESKPLFWVKWSKEPASTKILTKRILSAVLLKSAEAWDKADNIDSVAIQKYTNRLLDKVFKDSIDAYTLDMNDLADVPVNGKDLRANMNRYDTIRLQRSGSSQQMYDTVIITKANITGIRFIEEWSFDPATMALTKKVVGVCPIEQCFDENGIFKGFRVYFTSYFSDVWMPLDGKLELNKKN
jgi:hypothetical protein